MAARVGAEEAMRVLVTEFGAPVGATDKDGNTPLNIAAMFSDGSDAVIFLVNHCSPPVGARNNKGWTALHFAAFGGRDRIVRILSATDAKTVSIANYKGQTPLHVAARQGHCQTARVLMDEFGADVDARDNSGLTPFHLAAAHAHGDVLRLLAKKNFHCCAADVNAVSDTLYPQGRQIPEQAQRGAEEDRRAA